VKHSIPRLLKIYAWPYRTRYALGAVCLGLTNLLMVTIPLEIGRAIDLLTQGHDPTEAISLIMVMGLAIIGVRTLSRVFIFNPGRDVEYALRRDLFGTLLRHQQSFYSRRTTGDIVNRASNDIAFVRALVGFGMMQTCNVSIALSLTGWRMLSLSWELTLASVLPVVLALGIARMVIPRIISLHRRSQTELGEISEIVLQSFQGISTIQGFCAEDAFERRFEERNQALFKTRMSIALISAGAFPILYLAGSIGVGLVLMVGGPLAIAGELSVGDIAAFTALLGVLLPPLRSLGWMISVVKRGETSLERIFELMDVPIDRPEGDEPEPLPAVGLGPGFSIRGLDFAYPDEPDRQVLQGLDLEIEGASVVGVFGRTGSGKTTLLRILTRIYNPPPGTVFLRAADGQETDIRRVDLDGWRRQLSVVPQRPFLFSESIEANVAKGGGLDGVRHAVERAALSSDLEALPDGLQTVVGERGIMLSGGQRQRVALARALNRESGVVVLDDTLSAVDHSTEARLIEEISRDRGSGNTTLIVSHRISALRTADQIVVLEDGRIAAQGTHSELIAEQGLYREAFRAQYPDEAARVLE
jgi:ATP-binding cassette subfamily B protein